MMPQADDLDVVCVCRRPEHKPTPERPSLWETNRHGEKAESYERRLRQARILCKSCPMLEHCESELSRMEKEGASVDGIMAGRFSDVKTHGGMRDGAFTTVFCQGCKLVLIPQAKRGQIARAGRVQHVGEGLCAVCHPKYSRAARKNKTTRRAA